MKIPRRPSTNCAPASERPLHSRKASAEVEYARAPEQKVTFSWAPDKIIRGKDYLLQMTIPNTYFHLGMAYAILRHNGVDVGKMDFLGPVNLVAAKAS